MWHLAAVLGLLVAADPSTDEAACDFRIVGVANRQVIDDFVADVRARFQSSDLAAVADLIQFPLTVNARDPRFGATRHRTFANKGDFVVKEGQGSHAQGSRVLDREFRDRVVRPATDGLICRSGALGLAHGLIWARPGAGGKLYITTINNDAYRWPEMTKGELLRCKTQSKVVVIDRPGKLVRYRAWSSNKGTVGKPDELLEGGVESFEGTGPCVQSVWSFVEGTHELVVEEAGCAAEEDPQPIAFVSGQPCFEVLAPKSERVGERSQSASGAALALREHHPSAKWGHGLELDVDGDGVLDRAWLGSSGNDAVVGVVLGRTHRVLTQSFARAALCGAGDGDVLRAEPLTDRNDPDAPRGARKRAHDRRQGLRLDSGDCDAFHGFFDGKQLQWWRR